MQYSANQLTVINMMGTLALTKSSSAAVLAALWTVLRPHRSVQVSTTIKSSSAAVLTALWTVLGPHGSVQVSTTIKSSSAAVLAALWTVLGPQGWCKFRLQ